MPIKFVRFKPDRIGINGFMHSEQLRQPVRRAAEDVVSHARPESSTLAPDWKVERGPDVVLGEYGRLTEEVVNDNDAAAAIEFGSGRGRPGSSGDRAQGGYNYPQRILGRAGQKVGDYHDGDR